MEKGKYYKLTNANLSGLPDTEGIIAISVDAEYPTPAKVRNISHYVKCQIEKNNWTLPCTNASFMLFGNRPHLTSRNS